MSSIDVISPPHSVKARKPHYCDWCGKTIAKGEEYTVSTLRYDSIYQWHECDRCKEYVSEMYSQKDPWWIDEGLNGEDFGYFMDEFHPEVLKAWREQDAKEREL